MGGTDVNFGGTSSSCFSVGSLVLHGMGFSRSLWRVCCFLHLRCSWPCCFVMGKRFMTATSCLLNVKIMVVLE